MRRNGLLIIVGSLLLTTGVARSQNRAPLPPLPPVAPAPPVPPAAPQPFPMELWTGDLDDQILRAQEAAELAQEQLARPEIQEQLARARDRAAEAQDRLAGLKFNFGALDVPMLAQTHVTTGGRVFRRGSDDNGQYRRGQSAIERQRWDEALDAFSGVASGGGSRADGALYWKAYTLNKLGRREDALAALAELRKTYPSSRWLDDSKALEVEVKQASGQKVSPEGESDDEIKLLALNGLTQSDPERALPLLEGILKGAQSPRLKQRALFVLAQSSLPQAQKALEQVARGGGNPDLQITAISYIAAVRRRQGEAGPLLGEIYASASDINVKRAVLNSLAASRDKDRLLQIARTEKSPDLRMEAVESLAHAGDSALLWQLYQAETAPDVKERLLNAMAQGGNGDRLLEVARTEKDPRLRRAAIRSLVETGNAGDGLVALYGSEQDSQVRRAIVDTLTARNNVKGLVTLARNEHDPQMKRELVARLASMKSKEAEDYLMELVK